MGTIDLLHIGTGLLAIMLVLVMLLLPASKSKVCDDCGLECKEGDHPHEITGCPERDADEEVMDPNPKHCRHQVPLDKFCPSCADDLRGELIARKHGRPTKSGLVLHPKGDDKPGPGATICGGKPPF